MIVEILWRTMQTEALPCACLPWGVSGPLQLHKPARLLHCCDFKQKIWPLLANLMSHSYSRSCTGATLRRRLLAWCSANIGRASKERARRTTVEISAHLSLDLLPHSRIATDVDMAPRVAEKTPHLRVLLADEVLDIRLMGGEEEAENSKVGKAKTMYARATSRMCDVV